MTDALELPPGTLLRGKWRLDRFLGRGGMSSVHAATHRNGMRGAVKILHRELLANKQVKSRFMREGYVANKVKHPGAVRVLDDDETEDGLAFLVMDLLTGVTLKERWISADRKLPPVEVETVMVSVLGVLAAAHAQKIVHRDIKPDNIFLCDDGQVKVLDFGIARLADAQDGAGATTTTATLGTPAFMSPEQALAHWHRVDGRSDLFALGATAFTCLTGRLIHSGSTLPELLVAAATRQVVPISSLDSSLPPQLAEVIDKSLRFNIEERWSDAAAMLDALVPVDPNDATILMSEHGAPSTTPEGSSEAPTPRLATPSSPGVSPQATDRLTPDSPAIAPTMLASDSGPRVERPVKPTMVSTGTPQRAAAPQTLATPVTPVKTVQMPMSAQGPAPFLPEHLMSPTPAPTAAAVPEPRSARGASAIVVALAGVTVLAVLAFALPSLLSSKPDAAATEASPAASSTVATSGSSAAPQESADPALPEASSASPTASNPIQSPSAVGSASAPVKASKPVRPTTPKRPEPTKCPNGFDEYTGKPCR